MAARRKAVKGRKRMGRPKGSGKSAEEVRRHRVVILLRDAELRKLEELAAERGLPLGTAAYEILERSLRRRP